MSNDDEKLRWVERNINLFCMYIPTQDKALFSMEKLDYLMENLKSLETDKIIELMRFIDYLMNTYQKFTFPYDLLWEINIILRSMI